MKICLLIPTYKRNTTLLRLLKQCNGLVAQYRGPHVYEICVTDSVPDNEQADLIKSLCTHYVVNEGVGFDDNLYFFYKNHLADYDYVLSISDDDMVSCARTNPLHLIDVSIFAGHRAALFNHVNFTHAADGGFRFERPTYLDMRLTLNNRFMENEFLGRLPRHAGLLYSTEVIAKHLPVLPDFKNTLHLYAAPFILEEANDKICFIDYPLVYFCADPPANGAWENPPAVFDGLLAFLKSLKKHLPHNKYIIAHDGFMTNYLGDASWLRNDLAKKGCLLASEKEVSEILAA